MKHLIFACLLALIAAIQTRAADQAALANGVLVIVNDRVITLKDIHESMRQDLDFLHRRYGREPKALEEKIRALREEKTEQMVEHYLVLQEFQTLGYPLPESYINNRINEDIKRYGDRLTLTKTLQAEGLTFETYKTRIRENTILELMWASRVPRDPLISPAKIEKYFGENKEKFKVEDRVSLRMITLTNSPIYSPMSLAKEIAGKIREGASFAEMAAVYSQDSFGRAGGDRGWMERSAMREELAKVAFSLAPNTVSDPVETKDAVFLLYVDKAELAHTQPLSEVREDIEKTLKAQEVQRLRKQFVERLKKKSFVRYY